MERMGQINELVGDIEDRAAIKCEMSTAEAYAYKNGYIQGCGDARTEILDMIRKDMALKETASGRKKVFICSPFRGDTKENTKRAAGYSRMACRQGYLPVDPHLRFPQFSDEGKEDERELGIQMGLDLLSCCDEVWVFDGVTEGMLSEITAAVKMGKEVHIMDPDADGTMGVQDGGIDREKNIP